MKTAALARVTRKFHFVSECEFTHNVRIYASIIASPFGNSQVCVTFVSVYYGNRRKRVRSLLT